MESIFEAREIADFDFIWKQFDDTELIKAKRVMQNGVESITIANYAFNVQIQTIIPQLDQIDYRLWEYSPFSFQTILGELFEGFLPEAEEKSG